jgi:NADH-quinone oxidoreductase subunit J
MTAEQFFFYLFAAGTLAGSISVVAARNPINGALSLVSSFFCLAGLYVLLSAHFMAVLQILVYAGAVMVLFIFVLMLLNLGDDELGKPKVAPTQLIAAGVIACVGAVFMTTFAAWLPAAVAPADVTGTEYGTVAAIGHVLLQRHVLAFELVSVLLLAGIVGAVVIAKRRL